jgi:nifR3 family TIM-barrel protein
MNFWQQLKKPIIGLSPMDGVSDAAFRFIAAKYGKPDVIITEFISVDGIMYGAERIFADFLYHEIERPVIAQLFGNDPALFYGAAKVVCELGFDGVDINMGCPARTVASRGAGAALIRTPELARDIIAETKRGVADWVEHGTAGLPPKVLKAIAETKKVLAGLDVIFSELREEIPVSVKTRVGFDHEVISEWVPNLLRAEPANISIHGRTLKQMYSGSANWEAIAAAAKLVHAYNAEHGTKITVLGNGDVNAKKDYEEKFKASGVDGVLVGRSGFGNPWIFEQLRGNIAEITLAQKIEVAMEHSRMHEQVKTVAAFVEMRKHLGWYIKSFPGAARVRSELMQTHSAGQVEAIFAGLVS